MNRSSPRGLLAAGGAACGFLFALLLHVPRLDATIAFFFSACIFALLVTIVVATYLLE